MDNKLVETSCCICNSSEYEVLFKEGRDNEPINFSICKNCGLTYLNPRWTKDAYNEYYAREYDGNYRSDVLKPELDSSKYSTAKQIVNRMSVGNVLPKTPQRILDIGSGMGWSSVYLKDHVFKDAAYYAIEPSLHCIENLKNNGINLLSEDIDSDWDTGEEKFDLIIMRHVLEHFMDPVAVLKKVSNALTENGKLYVAVPNNNNPYSPLKTVFLRVVHTYYFSPHTIDNCFKLAGLKADFIKELDKANPYELFAVCSKAEASSADIKTSNYQETKAFFTKRVKQEGSVIGKMQLIAKRRLRKMFS